MSQQRGAIVSNWRQFCIDMGSVESKSGGLTLFLNDSVRITCGFANCALFTYDSQAQGRALMDKVRTRKRAGQFTGHGIGDQLLELGRPGVKTSVMMVLDSVTAKDPEHKIIDLSKKDVSTFADLVFKSFGYPAENRGDSERLYRRGAESPNIRMYAAQSEGKPVGCLLVHEANGCIGIELVSTLPEFRGKGIATSLVLHAIRNRSKGIGTVWLIATRGGNAERLYSKIGFKTIGFVESERMT